MLPLFRLLFAFALLVIGALAVGGEGEGQTAPTDAKGPLWTAQISSTCVDEPLVTHDWHGETDHEARNIASTPCAPR